MQREWARRMLAGALVVVGLSSATSDRASAGIIIKHTGVITSDPIVKFDLVIQPGTELVPNSSQFTVIDVAKPINGPSMIFEPAGWKKKVSNEPLITPPPGTIDD